MSKLAARIHVKSSLKATGTLFWLLFILTQNVLCTHLWEDLAGKRQIVSKYVRIRLNKI